MGLEKQQALLVWMWLGVFWFVLFCFQFFVPFIVLWKHCSINMLQTKNNQGTCIIFTGSCLPESLHLWKSFLKCTAVLRWDSLSPTACCIALQNTSYLANMKPQGFYSSLRWLLESLKEKQIGPYSFQSFRKNTKEGGTPIGTIHVTLSWWHEKLYIWGSAEWQGLTRAGASSKQLELLVMCQQWAGHGWSSCRAWDIVVTGGLSSKPLGQQHWEGAASLVEQWFQASSLWETSELLKATRRWKKLKLPGQNIVSLAKP